MAPIGRHRLITRPLARVGSVFSILHAESVINRRVWITYTAILCGLLALHVPFLIETRPFFAILVATLMADLAGGVFHIYCDHTAIRDDGSLLDDQAQGIPMASRESERQVRGPRVRAALRDELCLSICDPGDFGELRPLRTIPRVSRFFSLPSACCSKRPTSGATRG